MSLLGGISMMGLWCWLRKIFEHAGIGKIISMYSNVGIEKLLHEAVEEVPQPSHSLEHI